MKNPAASCPLAFARRGIDHPASASDAEPFTPEQAPGYFQTSMNAAATERMCFL